MNCCARPAAMIERKDKDCMFKERQVVNISEDNSSNISERENVEPISPRSVND